LCFLDPDGAAIVARFGDVVETNACGAASDVTNCAGRTAQLATNAG